MASPTAGSCICSPVTGSLGQSSQFFGRQIQVECGPSRVVCKKEGIHPKFFKESKVYCNGELVKTTSGTQEQYVVDVWSGNHPFYLGNGSTLMVDQDSVDKFNKKFGGLGALSSVPKLTKGVIVIEKKVKPGKKGRK
eukprot:TRINITY_DN22205_c0_g1_i1.p1 TRINITY_DN22205_c0_g1~~TRINITY_DN22205_c0_g1_i1.p1  ORF type:complete len:157 (+),score=28.49 TRINITY_DN22205_c0_g1_i1:63-473(+)